MYLDKIVSIFVTVADNGVLSNQGNIPWSMPEDNNKFNEITAGKPVIMGRKTLEFLGRPLPGRQNIILSKKGAGHIQGVELGDQSISVTLNLKSAIALAEQGEVIVIGGQKALKEALEFADKMYVMRVHDRPAGDRHFKYEDSDWNQTAVAQLNPNFTFFTYIRK